MESRLDDVTVTVGRGPAASISVGEIMTCFHHYRDKDKVEVDVIIENASGDCFGVEVKAAATLTARDFSGLRRFRSIAGKRFRLGVLLYDGDHTTAFGDGLFAVPIGAIWS